MRYLLAAFFSILLLAGCESEGGLIQEFDWDKGAPNQDEGLSLIRGESSWWSAEGMTDDLIQDTGDSVCRMLAADFSIDQVLGKTYRGGLPAAEAGQLIAYAVHYRCPEYLPDFDAWLVS